MGGRAICLGQRRDPARQEFEKRRGPSGRAVCLTGQISMAYSEDNAGLLTGIETGRSSVHFDTTGTNSTSFVPASIREAGIISYWKQIVPISIQDVGIYWSRHGQRIENETNQRGFVSNVSKMNQFVPPSISP